jgi:hypothetical protein
MKYTLFQLVLTHSMIDQINNLGVAFASEVDPKVQAYYDLLLGRNIEKHFRDGHYTKVAEIEANDLEHLFDIGNIGPEEKITRFDRMHSVSVGDVVVDERGFHHVVASIGFETLNL